VHRRYSLLFYGCSLSDVDLLATLDDMKEVKYMYRAQLEELLEKIAPEKA
jgi:hypothetical protein